MVFCSKCGSENKDSNEKCEKCGEFLLKPEFFESKKIENFEDIFTEENFRALNEITVETYYNVIANIMNMGHAHLENFFRNPQNQVKDMRILDKIRVITTSYVKIGYKYGGSDLGNYSFNTIFIDDRMYDSEQIATLIHELSHHLFSEILEQLLMNIWECDKSDAIEAFAWFIIIKSPLTILINEYSAHTSQGRFIPFGYQSYSSFFNIRNQNFNPEKDKELVEQAILFGNTISRDIIRILETFISPQLREEIKVQYKQDFPVKPNNDQILMERHEFISDEEKIANIIHLFSEGFHEAENKSVSEILEDYKHTFTEVNKS